MNRLRSAQGIFVAGLLSFHLASFAVRPATASAQATDDVALGEVVSITGDVIAIEAATGARRTLVCGDSLHHGDTVVTSTGARAGLLFDLVYVQLDPGTRLALARDAAGRMDLELDEGRVRVIDPRREGDPLRLVAGTAHARIAGNDAEAYLLAEKAGTYAMLCEWDDPLQVTRGAESRSASPGECVIAKSREPLYTAKAHDERIAFADADRCEAGMDPLAVADLFSPTDVAAGPLGFDPFPDPVDSGPLDRSPCDEPGSGCSGPLVAPIATPPSVIDPEPDTGTCPPGFPCGDQGASVIEPVSELDACPPGFPCQVE
jgi:hypothetical protein